MGILKNETSIKDQEIKLLSRTLPFVIKTTVSKYYPAWKKWLEWCRLKSEVCERPAEPFYVAIYLNHLLFTTGKKGAILAAMYGIRWGHRNIGLKSPTDNSLVQLACEGCIRLCGGKTVKKEAMPVHVIKDLVDTYCEGDSNLLDLRFVVACLLGFTGFFQDRGSTCHKAWPINFSLSSYGDFHRRIKNRSTS